MLKRIPLLFVLVLVPVLALAAGGKSAWLSANLLNHQFRSTAYTGPANAHVGLLTTCPTTGNLGTEVSTSGTAYGRQPVAKGDSSWTITAGSAIAAQTITNVSAITFITATASWGTVNCFGIWDQSSGGNLLYWGPLNTPQLIGSGNQASFAAGQLSISEN